MEAATRACARRAGAGPQGGGKGGGRCCGRSPPLLRGSSVRAVPGPGAVGFHLPPEAAVPAAALLPAGALPSGRGTAAAGRPRPSPHRPPAGGGRPSGLGLWPPLAASAGVSLPLPALALAGLPRLPNG